MELIKLPIVIGGKPVYPEEGNGNYSFTYEDLQVQLPKLTPELIHQLDSLDGAALHNLEISEIADFLSRVAKLWADPDYKYRKLLLELGPKITTLSRESILHNIGMLILYIGSKTVMQDNVETEFGNIKILDDWVPRFDVLVHAEPLGKLLHIISGNVPTVGMYSLVRGILTKNINIAKLSGKDYINALLFIRSFYDVDPEHPVTRSVSAAYWERNDDEVINHFASTVNGICVWGGQSTMERYRAASHPGCELMEYGPKIGMQLIKWDGKDNSVPLNAARDASVFDQEACFSPQLIFLEGDGETFCKKLADSLARYARLWPKGTYEKDHYAHMNYVIQANLFFGNKSYYDEGRNYLVIHVKNKTEISLDHPLGRTLYVYSVDDVREGLDYVNENIQTIGVSPSDLAFALKDELAKRGVYRIANVGNVEIPRFGAVHNGHYMTRLVRMVALEREASYKYKEYDQTEDSLSDFTFRLKN